MPRKSSKAEAQAGAVEGSTAQPAATTISGGDASHPTPEWIREARNCLIYDLPEDIYHPLEAIGGNTLKAGVRSPRHLDAALHSRRNKPPTDAMIIGSACHALLEGPGAFYARYAVLPAGLDGRSSEARKLRETARAEGKTPISSDDAENVLGVGAALNEHPIVSEMMHGAKHEVSGFWEDPETGLWCKCRLDLWRGDIAAIFDLKKTQDASPSEFRKTIERYYMYLQAAHYMACPMLPCRPRLWAWIAVEELPPHGLVVYTASQQMLEKAASLRGEILRAYKAARDNGKFPCYPVHPIELDLSRWAVTTLEG